MFSKIIYSILFIHALCLLLLPKVNAQSAETTAIQTTETAAPEIAQPFVQTELLSPEVAAFQDRAPQKLQDFADYIQLLSDEKNAEEIREVTRAALRQLFQKKDATIQFYNFSKKAKQSSSLSDFLKIVEASETPLNITFHDCKNAANLVNIGNQYTWTVPCNWQWSSGEKTVYTEMTFEAFLIKKEKQFGARTLVVWEVLLGDVMDFKIL